MTRKEVFKELLIPELDYAQYRDDRRKSEDNPKFDKDKDVKAWLAWMKADLSRAFEAAYSGTDKSKALDYVRKVTALGVSCMMYNDTPARKQPFIVGE